MYIHISTCIIAIITITIITISRITIIIIIIIYDMLLQVTLIFFKVFQARIAGSYFLFYVA